MTIFINEENKLTVIKKTVSVELRTVIDDQGDKELSIIKQKGEYIKKHNLEVIKFVDKVEDIGEIKNLITIQPGKVNIKRSGAIGMNQQFLRNKVTECLYRHPYGQFHLEINTTSMKQQALMTDGVGQVVIEYEGTLNGDHVRQHHLTLTYLEEESS